MVPPFPKLSHSRANAIAFTILTLSVVFGMLRLENQIHDQNRINDLQQKECVTRQTVDHVMAEILEADPAVSREHLAGLVEAYESIICP